MKKRFIALASVASIILGASLGLTACTVHCTDGNLDKSDKDI